MLFSAVRRASKFAGSHRRLRCGALWENSYYLPVLLLTTHPDRFTVSSSVTELKVSPVSREHL